MKKKLFIALALVIMIISYGNLYAQEGSSSRIGFQVGGYLPLGEYWSDDVSTGIGGSALYNYKIIDKISLTGAVGYYHFLKGDPIYQYGMDENETNIIGLGYYYITCTIVSVLGGLQYNILSADKTVQPYVGCESGLFLVTFNWERIKPEGNVFDTGAKTRSCFGFAPAVGFRFKLGLNVDLDVNAKWSFVEYRDDLDNYKLQYNHIGLNFGLLFRI